MEWNHRYTDFQSADGSSRGLQISRLQRLPPRTPGSPRDNYGTLNGRRTHPRHERYLASFTTGSVRIFARLIHHDQAIMRCVAALSMDDASAVKVAPAFFPSSTTAVLETAEGRAEIRPMDL